MLKHKPVHLVCILTVNRSIGWLKRVLSLLNYSVHLPGGKVEYPHETAEAAARGVGGGVSARYSRPQEAAARAGWSHRGQWCHEPRGQLSQEQTQVGRSDLAKKSFFLGRTDCSSCSTFYFCDLTTGHRMVNNLCYVFSPKWINSNSVNYNCSQVSYIWVHTESFSEGWLFKAFRWPYWAKQWCPSLFQRQPWTQGVTQQVPLRLKVTPSPFLINLLWLFIPAQTFNALNFFHWA